MYDIAIIGAGVVGAMTARELSAYDLRVVVLEKENDVAMGSTKANSAIVHAGFDAKCGTLKAKLNVEGSKMMEEVCRKLGVSYKRNGSLVVCYDEAERDKVAELYGNGLKNGVEGLRIIEKEELLTLEPNIDESAVCALHAPSGAIVCPYELTIEAMGNAMDNGVELKLNYEVADIAQSGGGYTIKSVSGELTEAKIIINAAGLYADKIAEMAGCGGFSIRPRKGEYMLLDKECAGLVKSTVFTLPTKMGKGILVSPTVDDNVILGPTSENIDDKDNKATTVDGLNVIRSKAGKMVRNIDFRMVITSFSGLRAVGDTGDFIINSPRKSFINAAAIESPGLSASPAIAKYIIGILTDNGVELKPDEKFKDTRTNYRHFKSRSDEEREEVIRRDPTFAKIVCRCEGISEGEIRYALRTEPRPRDLDGVKRRTRAQMGRCQGGFCSPSIVKLIAEELNIPVEDVTKSGKNSYVTDRVLKVGDIDD